jgi:Tfp pilus assembly protein PilF
MKSAYKNKKGEKKSSNKPLENAKNKSNASGVFKKKYQFYSVIFLLFIISIVTFSPSLKNEFIDTWDDGVYVLNNQLLRDVSWQGILNIFKFNDEFQRLTNNYHPITTFSLALNYQMSALNPSSYHLTNVITHGFNAILVFIFIYFLSKKRIWPAIIAGLLFSIHPMHVESVSWISERKDVLYTFLFIAGLISYLKYLEDGKIWKLLITLILFIFSCLSKAMAVPFPFVLLLIDYFQRRKFSMKLIYEKIPFIVIAIIIGIMSVNLQSTTAINKFETFTLYQRIIHASYGFITYIFKFINPSNLSAFYPYPSITQTGQLPFIFRISPYICLIIAALIIWLITKKKEIPRIIVFGILFYLFTIALVLQFVSVGRAIIADRYTYIPYIGLSFIVGMLADYYIQKKSSDKYIGYFIISITLILSIVFAFKTTERTKVWKNNISLWSNAIEQNPDVRLNFIYEKRARTYLEKDLYELALKDYNTIATNDIKDDNAMERIGYIYGAYYNELEKSITYLEKANKINPKNLAVLKNLGVAMGMKGEHQNSLTYFLKAYEINKTDSVLLQNISSSYKYMGKMEEASKYEQLAKTIK